MTARRAIPFASLEAMRACGDSLRWLRGLPDDSLDAAWARCDRGDWMLWLIGMEAESEPFRSIERRRLSGCLAEILISLSLPLCVWHAYQPCDAVASLLGQHADGKTSVTRRDLEEAAQKAVLHGIPNAAAAAYVAYADGPAKDIADAAYASAYGPGGYYRQEHIVAAADIVRAWYPEAPEI